MSMMTANSGTGRWVGVGLVAALHVGLFAAISSGLNIHVIKEIPLPFHWVDLPPDTPVKTEPVKPEFDSSRMSNRELPPLPPPDIKVSQDPPIDPPDTRADDGRDTVGGGHGVVLDEPFTQSSIDPRHPLTEPEYPPRSRLLNEQGKVRLKIHVMTNGRIDSVVVLNSSGYQRLDDAAIQHALKHWSMVPASKGGNAVDSWIEIPVVFRLN